MKDITLVILCAGNSTRFDNLCKKQWLRVGDAPLWLNVTNRVNSYYDFAQTIVVSHKDELNYMQNFADDYIFVEGGETRQESIRNALNFVKTPYVMISDVARACIEEDVVKELIKNRDFGSCIVPILNVNDTVVFQENTINRDEVKLIQTPQLSKTEILKKALLRDTEFTDESSAIKSIREDIFYIKGSIASKKLTFIDDIGQIPCLEKPSNKQFIGIGYDIHAFEEQKEMFLGGIKLPYSYGFKAHSDGDVLIHSLIDAILGAIGAGDIGEFFPDTNDEFKGIDSKILLEKILNFVHNVGYELINIDITIIAQKPKINPHKNEIKNSLSKLLNLPKQFINIKASTAEKLGAVGRAEGVVVQAIANLKYYDWTKK